MKKLTTALLALGAGLAAQASTLTYTDWDPSTGFTPVASGTTTLSYNSAFEVPKFNPGLGTLTKVSWYIYVDFSGTVEFTSASPDPQDVEISYGTKHTISSATYGVSEITQPLVGPFLFPNVLNGDTITVGPETGWDEDDGFTTNAGLLANWTGAGNANIPLTHQSVLEITGGGSLVDINFLQEGRSYIEVTYTYTDGVVPEPGTYVGGLALLGVGALAYRRMRRA